MKEKKILEIPGFFRPLCVSQNSYKMPQHQQIHL